MCNIVNLVNYFAHTIYFFNKSKSSEIIKNNFYFQLKTKLKDNLQGGYFHYMISQTYRNLGNHMNPQGYHHYVFGHFYKSPKTYSVGIFPIDDFPDLPILGKLYESPGGIFSLDDFNYKAN
jgi:hypothetical protein